MINKISKTGVDLYKEQITELIRQNLEINLHIEDNSENRAIELWKNLKKFTEDNSAIILGAFEEKRILGFLWAYERETIGKELFITQLIVEENNRGRGIGKHLLEELYVIAKELEINRITLLATASNKAAMAFYQSCGFYPERIQFGKDLR